MVDVGTTACSPLSAPTLDREEPMIREALRQEIYRLFTVERWSKAAIARMLDRRGRPTSGRRKRTGS
jgi:hypothetical protein